MKLRNNDKVKFSDLLNEFELLYAGLRSAEKRMYTDDEVAWLPDIAGDHVYKSEWQIRKASCKKLIKYLQRRNRPMKILEVGCGNGWLSYQLSQIRYSDVVGIDINFAELKQAERVFNAIPNLRFIYGDLDSLLRFERFDIIIFAASIQYFPSFSKAIETAFSHLNKHGEIHITDSHFYSEADVESARRRSVEYFQGKGFAKMGHFYFHHTLNELERFNYSILYDPCSLLNKILKRRNPFHWICLKQ